MYCKHWIAFAFLILAILHVNAQQTSPQERPWESILMELMTADDIDADDWEDQYEALCDMEQEPLNINTATREQRSACPSSTSSKWKTSTFTSTNMEPCGRWASWP